MLTNKKTVAAIFGVSTNTVGKWMVAGCPHRKDGREVEFETVEVLEWMYDEKPTLNVIRNRDDDERDGLDPDQERARKDAAHADKLEMDLAERRGELVDAEELDAMNAEVDGIIRTSMLALAKSEAPALATEKSARKVTVHLDAAIRKALSNLDEDEEDMDD